MSFECSNCGFKNAEVQSAGEIQPQGHKYKFRVEQKQDLSRQIVKSDTCVFRVEDVDLEAPPGRGQLTNVEGLLAGVQEDLSAKQAERKVAAPELCDKIESIVQCLSQMSSGQKLPFEFSLDDPAGNSWIEPSPDDKNGKYVRRDYDRTTEQNAALGLTAPTDATNDSSSIRPEYRATQLYPQPPPEESEVNNVDDEDIIENEVYTFPASCPGCSRPCATKMKMVNIPHFQQVVIMSTVCDECGCKY
jgi:zinc finger protein